eukprot:UN10969
MTHFYLIFLWEGFNLVNTFCATLSQNQLSELYVICLFK